MRWLPALEKLLEGENNGSPFPSLAQKLEPFPAARNAICSKAVEIVPFAAHGMAYFPDAPTLKKMPFSMRSAAHATCRKALVVSHAYLLGFSPWHFLDQVSEKTVGREG